MLRNSQTHLPHSFPLVHTGEQWGLGSLPLLPSHPQEVARWVGGTRRLRGGGRILLPPPVVSTTALALASPSFAFQVSSRQSWRRED